MPPEKKQSDTSDIFLIVEFRPRYNTIEYSQAVMESISPEGLSFDSSNHELKPGDVLDVKLSHPRSDVSVSLLGEIVSTRESWYKSITRIKYKDIDEETESKIAKLIFEVKNKRSGPSIHGKDDKTLEIRGEEEGPAAEPDISQEEKIQREALKENIGADPEETGDAHKEDPSVIASVITGSIDRGSGKSTPSHTIEKEKTDNEQKSDIDPKVSNDKTLPEDEGPAISRGTHAETKDHRRKSLLYIPLAAAFAVVAIFILSDKFMFMRQELKTQNAKTDQIPVPDAADNQRAEAVDNIVPDNTTAPELVDQARLYETSDINNEMPEEESVNSSEQTIATPVTGQESDKEQPLVIADNALPDSSPGTENISHITNPGMNINFDKNSDVVTPDFYSQIDKIADTLLNYPDALVTVTGYTDNTGPESYNVDLSVRRAEAVKNLLVQRGVSTSVIEISGLGDSNPVDTNDSTVGRNRNRRVEIEIIPSGSRMISGH